MIQGVVNAEFESVVKLIARDINGRDAPFDAVVDTGFTGWLTLPPHSIAALQLGWRERDGAILADGSRISFNVYDAPILWDGQFITLPVDEADADPLIGMRLMKDYRNYH